MSEGLSPITNTTMEELAQAIKACSSFALSGHVNADGDCLGSVLGLGAALRAMGKQVTCLMPEDATIEPALQFLPGLKDMVVASRFDETPEAFIALDISEAERLGESFAVLQRCPKTFTLDHHMAKAAISQLSFIDPTSASCTVLVWELLQAMEIVVPDDTAMCLYTGLMTDTGRFQFQNVDARAFNTAAQLVDAGVDVAYVASRFYQSRRLESYKLESCAVDHMELLADGAFAFTSVSLADFAAAGADKSDAETLIDVLRSLQGVRVACVLKEAVRNGELVVRGSFRAKDDTDVRALAQQLGGGGHKAAAGFTLHESLDKASTIVKEAVLAALGASV